MKIAIHHESNNFSERWIEFCDRNSLDYKIVDCFSNDVINQLKDFDILLWHWNHRNPAAFLFARQLIISLEQKGICVFPSSATCWHYDDKVGQKYLLESIGAPLVPTFVFYRLTDALSWIEDTEFPKVFKLRGGYGSNNVRLIKTKRKAMRLARKAFSTGFSQRNRMADLKNRLWKFRKSKSIRNTISIAKGVTKLFLPSKLAVLGKEMGYIYFQEFIPENKYDIRIIIIGNRAIGIKRFNRKNDFRASGSGVIDYDPKSIDTRTIDISFEIAKRLNSQSVAFDFVFDTMNQPLIVEISYCYSITAYDKCLGYWDRTLKWHSDRVNLQKYIIEDLTKK